MYSRRLLAIDPSLTCSGWALFSIDSGKLLGVGKIRALSAHLPLAERYRDLQQRIHKIYRDLKLNGNDVLICEAPTTMRDPRAAFKVEQVRGIFETVARSLDVQVPGRINPRSVHREVMGLRGKQLPRERIKEVAVTVVRSLYKSELNGMGFQVSERNLTRNQDIVDAILIGNLSVTKIESAERLGVSLDEFFDRDRAARKMSAHLGRLKRASVGDEG